MSHWLTSIMSEDNLRHSQESQLSGSQESQLSESRLPWGFKNFVYTNFSSRNFCSRDRICNIGVVEYLSKRRSRGLSIFPERHRVPLLTLRAFAERTSCGHSYTTFRLHEESRKSSGDREPRPSSARHAILYGTGL